jgi:hypothetical protein
LIGVFVDAWMGIFSKNSSQQMPIESCGMDPDPVSIIFLNDADFPNGVLILPADGSPAGNNYEAIISLDKFQNQIFEFFQKFPVYSFRRKYQRPAERNDDELVFHILTILLPCPRGGARRAEGWER